MGRDGLPDEKTAAADPTLVEAERGTLSHTGLHLAEGDDLSTGIAILELRGVLLVDGASAGDALGVGVDGLDVGLDVAREVADLDEVGRDEHQLAVETLW